MCDIPANTAGTAGYGYFIGGVHQHFFSCMKELVHQRSAYAYNRFRHGDKSTKLIVADAIRVLIRYIAEGANVTTAINIFRNHFIGFDSHGERVKQGMSLTAEKAFFVKPG